MMISPTMYIRQFKDCSYNDLIEERNGLISDIQEFERKEQAGDRKGDEWLIEPGPDVQYQMHLEYLAELCKLIHEKYKELPDDCNIRDWK